jgi:NhaB family Na+:H+ antiporter
VLSAFSDALTVVAVIITVGFGFYSVYHKVASGKNFHSGHDHSHDDEVPSLDRNDLEDFRVFLRYLMMHAGVGIALGAVMTMVGKPQNLIIADKAGGDFIEFFIRKSPITIPVFFARLATTFLIEKCSLFNYGAQLPQKVRQILTDYDKDVETNLTKQDKAKLAIQGLIAVWLVIGLDGHLADIGLIGLSIIVLTTSMGGVIDEHSVGKVF